MNSRIIFVTGGVVSGLGKGIFSAALGSLFDARGSKISFIKLDPYLNVDPGTMNPLQHGEVFVTDDGAETDLDLGHYERFVPISLSQKNNVTSGQIYQHLIQKERTGGFLGETVQVIPHMTDEIKQRILDAADGTEILIAEIGGTVGDIESQPFLEAARQLSLENPSILTCFIHLTWVPWIPATGEIKTKPTQHSVKALRALGMQPDFLICRSEQLISKEQCHKIALHGHLRKDCVIPLPDVDSIYDVPLHLSQFQTDAQIFTRLQLKANPLNLQPWLDLKERRLHLSRKVTIALVGKYLQLQDAYKSLYEALRHAGIHKGVEVLVCDVDAEQLEKSDLEVLSKVDGVLVPGGFGKRGIQGKIDAIEYARKQGIPFLGICLGMQLAVIEVLRNVGDKTNAHSTEFEPNTSDPVVALIHEWQPDVAMKETMRLGAETINILPNTYAHQIYQQDSIKERHRHRYEVNHNYIPALKSAGLRISAHSSANDLVEMVELESHPWFVACQFHPEFLSRPALPHPLFSAFIQACIDRSPHAN